MNELSEYRRPWRTERSPRRKARGGFNTRIRSADNYYIAEHFSDPELAQYIVDAVNERDQLRGALAATTARVEAAEAKLAAVPDYATYYTIAWETFEADSDGPEPLDFDAWLAQQQSKAEAGARGWARLAISGVRP